MNEQQTLARIHDALPSPAIILHVRRAVAITGEEIVTEALLDTEDERLARHSRIVLAAIYPERN